MGVHVTLLQSDTVQSYGLVKTGTSPVGVGLRKKPKDLIASDVEERGHWKGVGLHVTLFQSDILQAMVAQNQTRGLWGLAQKKNKGPECK